MNSALYTDFYELTMTQGYLLGGRAEEPAVFDYYFRTCPFGGSFVVFAGLGDLLQTLEELHFSTEEIEYLRQQGFQEPFLRYLAQFRFKGTVWAAQEGEIVFPNEPILRVEGNLADAQLVESLVLNYLNYQSLIATKAARICLAAQGRRIIDFGLRRAQGWGSIHGSRAAIIGGVAATSNVFAGFRYNLPMAGTQAHSWILSFPDELTAFREYARYYPDQSVFLVDTYDTIYSGLPNAITVAKELESRGHQLQGIRLDSGNLAALAFRSRQLLDEAGLNYVKIIVSDNLDEFAIQQLVKVQAPIDAFGVGTQLITGQPTGALNGVYKLCLLNDIPRTKISENIRKTTLPGPKKIVRYRDSEGRFKGDVIIEQDEYPELVSAENLLRKVMMDGNTQIPAHSPQEIARFVRKRLRQLPERYKELEQPQRYSVQVSESLRNLHVQLVENLKKQLRP